MPVQSRPPAPFSKEEVACPLKTVSPRPLPSVSTKEYHHFPRSALAPCFLALLQYASPARPLHQGPAAVSFCEVTAAGTNGDCPLIDDRPTYFRFVIALVLLIVCLTAPAWAEYKAVKESYDLAVERGDYATAIRELRPLAEQGLAAAQFNLALLYANGQGMPKDDAQARQWYEKAAAQGHAEAQVNLGILLVYARGGPQDYKMAVYWLRLSANQGNDLAQRKLGLMYERGDGVQQDYVRAYMWYSLGAANGVEAGARLRDAIAKRMDPDQIAEAQQLAREWKTKGK